MSDATYIDQAASWADFIVGRENRGPGDLENAMERAARKHDVPMSVLWALRYRRPRNLFVSIYFRLHEAYQAELDRQMRQLTHEIEFTKALTGPDCRAVCAAEALVGTQEA